MKKLKYLILFFILVFSVSTNSYAAKAPKLNKTYIVINAKDTYKLKVKNKGKNKIKWKSSKSKIASVSKTGVITAKKKGNCKIYATVGKRKLTCYVKVLKYVEPTSDQVLDELLLLTNNTRIDNNKQPLILDKTLCKIAQTRANDLVIKYGHTRPNGESCFELMDEYDYNFMCVGENIAGGQNSPEEAINYWLDSPGHRRNMLNRKYKRVGFGFIKSENSIYGYYWVTVFSD